MCPVFFNWLFARKLKTNGLIICALIIICILGKDNGNDAFAILIFSSTQRICFNIREDVCSRKINCMIKMLTSHYSISMKRTILFLFPLVFGYHAKSQLISIENNPKISNIQGNGLCVSFAKKDYSNHINYCIKPLPLIEELSQWHSRRDLGFETGADKAPSRFYAKLTSGYGLLQPGSYKVQSNNIISYFNQNGDQHDTTVQIQGKRGIGGGLKFGAGIGYVVNDFINIGIDAEYLMGSKLTNSFNLSFDYGSSNSSNYSATDVLKYKAVTVTPYIIFKALAKPNYFVYNKLGILFTLPFTLHSSGSSVNTLQYNWNPSVMDSLFKANETINAQYTADYKISLGIGFNVAFGVNFRVNNNLRVFGELFGNFSALSPASSLIHVTTKTDASNYTFNLLTENKSIVNNITGTTYQKEGLVVNNQSSFQNLPDTPDGYMQSKANYSSIDQKFNVNMNAIGINIGIMWRF